jgi:hypothetical protein
VLRERCGEREAAREARCAPQDGQALPTRDRCSGGPPSTTHSIETSEWPRACSAAPPAPTGSHARQGVPVVLHKGFQLILIGDFGGSLVKIHKVPRQGRGEETKVLVYEPGA